MNGISFVSFDSFKDRTEIDDLSAPHLANKRSEASSPDLVKPSQENEPHVRAGQTWDDAARSWGQMVNREFSWESTRRRYGEMVVNAVKDKIEAIQNLPSEIGDCCCGALRKPEKESLVDPQNSFE